ncbi:MAG: hypothetical protein KTR30_08700 [Saprospiraceae bacterium]|nr:hypothetical protein [Saprospiraceae bacterium]
MKTFALVFSNVFLIYLLLGVAFAIVFITLGVGRLDEKAKGTSWWFKALIFPGSIALWPVLLLKWVKKSK